MMRYQKTVNVCIAVLAYFFISGVAQADPRFVLLLDKQGAADSLEKQIEQVLPQLWDRILPQASRTLAPAVNNPRTLLRRVQSGRQQITLELNPPAVWALLQERGIPALRKMPHIKLDISLLNKEGNEMKHAQLRMAQEAAKTARKWGLALDPDASEVQMKFSWLEKEQVNLHVAGSALLAEFEEKRQLQGDSLSFVTGWIQGYLLQLRDKLVPPKNIAKKSVQTAPQIDTTAGPAVQEKTSPTLAPTKLDGTLIVIRKKMPLSQQLLFEQAMKKEKRIKKLLPLSFSNEEQQYLLKMRTQDQLWIKPWFEARGMQASKMDGGWLIR